VSLNEQTLRAELRRQAAPAWHIPDHVRIGVLAGLEEYETWLQAHLLRCQACRQPIVRLLGKLQGSLGAAPGPPVACAPARAALFHYLEDGREPALPLLHHITTCEGCSQPFYEPAKALVLLEFEPEDVGEGD
jgi:hypothetical protein